jgi:hypothetical protein
MSGAKTDFKSHAEFFSAAPVDRWNRLLTARWLIPNRSARPQGAGALQNPTQGNRME